MCVRVLRLCTCGRVCVCVCYAHGTAFSVRVLGLNTCVSMCECEYVV